MEILECYSLFDSVLPTGMGIYRIFNKITGKYYIGSARAIGDSRPASKGFRVRLDKHRWELKHNKHHSRYLQSSYNKVLRQGMDPNDVFEIHILEYVEHDRCLEVEDYYLKKYKPDYNGRLNAAGGKEKGYARKDKSKKEKPPKPERIKYAGISPAGEIIFFSNAAKFVRDNPDEEFNYNGINNCSRGITKMHQGWRFFQYDTFLGFNGEIPPVSFVELGRAFVAVSPRGEVINFVNATRFAEDNPEWKFKSPAISRCADGKRSHYKGWRFFYQEDYEAMNGKIPELTLDIYSRTKTFVGISPTGERHIFSNMAKFCKENPDWKFDRHHISFCVKGIRESYKGWTFSYYDESLAA